MCISKEVFFPPRTFLSHKTQEETETEKEKNKPKLATMRPDRVSAHIDHVTHMD